MSTQAIEAGNLAKPEIKNTEPRLLELLGHVMLLEAKTIPERAGRLLAKLQDRQDFLGAAFGGNGQRAELRRHHEASRLEGFNELDIAA